jgi:hypothetical protein
LFTVRVYYAITEADPKCHSLIAHFLHFPSFDQLFVLVAKRSSTMAEPRLRCVPTRSAAARAVNKIKANLEQVKDWEVKDFEEASLKFAVSKLYNISNHDPNDRSSQNLMKKQRFDCCNDREVHASARNELCSQGSSESSMVSNTTLFSSTVSEFFAEDSIDSDGCNQCSDMKMTFSEAKRWVKAVKAHARSQHSGKRMFLSRRLSRKIRDNSSPFSPTFSPIAAITLIFSPELVSHPKNNKELRCKQKSKRRTGSHSDIVKR